MGKSRAIPKPPTGESLNDAAMRYLERYSSSIEGVRRVLRRRVYKAARAGQGEAAHGYALVETIIARLTKTGLLDDARYAEARAGAMARRGGSFAIIRRDLAKRGVARAEIDAAIAVLKGEIGDGTSDEADKVAALTLAKRRRLGPFRAAAQRAAFRTKDLAALGRAGFSFEVAKSVIDGEAESG